MGSTQSISFRKRNEVDEIYNFPYETNQATLKINNSVVMVKYQEDESVLVIAGNLPGVGGYFNNYPENTSEDKERRHAFANELFEEAKEFLSGYNPQRSVSSSNSGNQSLRDLYVTVDEEKRDEVVMQMWKMLNHMRDQYIEFLSNQEEEDHYEYPALKDEILRISKKPGL